jgi:hypothetical protein
VFFLPPWLLFTLDPELIDGCSQSYGLSLSSRCWSVVFGVSVFFVVSCVSLSGCDPVFRVSIRLGCGCVVCLGFRVAFS